MEERKTVEEKVRAARRASGRLRATPRALRDRALEAIAEELEGGAAQIAQANGADLTRAHETGLAAPLQKRLRFDEAKLRQAVAGVRSVAALPDPVGRVMVRRELDDGLLLTQETTPIGVIAMIFESRPDALVQIASLALKSGNAIVLKGGSEARESNRALAAAIVRAGERVGVPHGWLQLIESRSDVAQLLTHDQLVDLVIPRGSNAFVRYIMDNTRIPVMGHADGVCHLYIDRAAQRDRAVKLAVDSKVQSVSVCNAIETLLVHHEVVDSILPMVLEALFARGVEVRGDQRACAVCSTVKCATAEDWRAEYLDYTVAVRVVDSLDEAIEHINLYGSGHTDAIATEDRSAAARFLSEVDSASVMHNASTRFADGFRYGLGAEVGISTSRIHARGPVGLEGLCTYRWIVRGEGHIVAPYAEEEKQFTHRELPRS